MAKNYEVISFHRLHGEKKEKLWLKEPRQCRYCGTTKPPNKGWKEAHALPEFIGNKTIIAMDECTDCNSIFSTTEDHFGKLLQLTRTSMQLRGKKGVPSYKTRRGESRIDVRDGKVHITQIVGDPLAVHDPVTNTIDITSSSQPLVPIAVYKSLVKMAIAIMPPGELPNFKHTIEWVQKTDHKEWAADVAASAICVAQFLPGPQPTDFGWGILFRRRHPSAKLPYMIFVVRFGNQSFQIMIPCSPRDNHWVGERVEMPLYPAFYGLGHEYGELMRSRLPLSSAEPTSVDISLSFTSD